jgi:hypothetical protein
MFIKMTNKTFQENTTITQFFKRGHQGYEVISHLKMAE